MLKFLPCIATVILEDADVLETRVALQILNALRRQQQELSDLRVARSPEMAFVPQILDQHLVRSDRGHAIVNSISAAGRLTLNAIQRRGMNYGTGRPRASADGGHIRHQLNRNWRVRAETANRFHAGSVVRHVVAGNNPGTGNWILAQLHGIKENIEATNRQL
jgi:hypothetical protein